MDSNSDAYMPILELQLCRKGLRSMLSSVVLDAPHHLRSCFFRGSWWPCNLQSTWLLARHPHKPDNETAPAPLEPCKQAICGRDHNGAARGGYGSYESAVANATAHWQRCTFVQTNHVSHSPRCYLHKLRQRSCWPAANRHSSLSEQQRRPFMCRKSLRS